MAVLLVRTGRFSMRAMRWISWLMVAAMVGGWSSGVTAGPSQAQRCEAQKNLAAGANAECLAREYAKEVQGHTSDFAICGAPLAKAFATAERHAGPGECTTEGDTAAIEAVVDVCMADIAGQLAGNPPPLPPPPPCTQAKVTATGQTTCWGSTGTVTACAGTGEDGEFRAGAAPSYTDNRDGTVTDNNTGLMWEKKSRDGSIHDVGVGYTWDNAFAVHIAGLNAGAGFAGHTDWRLPNVKELQSLINYERIFPAVSEAFNAGCRPACTVLTCSCPGGGWSSTTEATFKHFALVVDLSRNGWI